MPEGCRSLTFRSAATDVGYSASVFIPARSANHELGLICRLRIRTDVLRLRRGSSENEKTGVGRATCEVVVVENPIAIIRVA